MKESYINKNRRLRKKLYLGEFAIHGFQFNCKVKSGIDRDLTQFLDEIVNLVESLDLNVAGGGCEDNFSMIVCSNYRYGSVTEEERNVILTWLSNNDQISDVNIGELIDVNYNI